MGFLVSEKVLFIGISHKMNSCYSIVKVSLKVNMNAPNRGWTLNCVVMVKAI